MDRKEQDRLVNKYCMNCEVGLYNCKKYLLNCPKVQKGEKSKRKCFWHERLCDRAGDCMECEHSEFNAGKPNFTAEPMQAIRECSYGVTITVCPACHEPAYEEGRCIFCGQRYAEPEQQPEDKPTIKGGYIAENGAIVCDQCAGTDLRFVYHADGRDTYRNGYNCAGCGAVIQMIFKRRR